MQSTFDFDLQKSYAQSIEVEDIGSCALRCTNPEFNDYYIIVQTVMGKTSIIKFGPLVADIDTLPELFDLSYKVIDYKEQTIEFEIKKLLTDLKKKINQVEQIEITEALSMIPDNTKFLLE